MWYYFFMVTTPFLEDQKYTFLIAKIAIVFQTVATSVISMLLLLMVCTVSFPLWILVLALTLDSIFVCCHLSYRVLYRGKKIVLSSSEKKILGVHIITSLVALFVTLFIVLNTLTISFVVLVTALISWCISLISGVVFFYKKYKYSISSFTEAVA